MADSPDTQLNELALRSFEGDLTAWDPLFEAIHPRMLGLAFDILCNWTDAEEAVSSALLSVFRFFDPGKASGGLIPFALMLTAQAAWRILAKRRREAELEYPETIPDPQSVEIEPLFDTERLHSCLETLTDDQRSTLHWKFHEDRSFNDIAEELNLGVHAVRKIYHYSLLNLRRCMSAA